jgi:hypothetical protein
LTLVKGSKTSRVTGSTSRKAAKPVSQQSSGNANGIDSRTSELICNEILKSMVRNPNMTKSEQSAVTHKLASRFNVSIYAVAGVRAALTRGVYGNSRTLLNNMRKTLGLNAKTAVAGRK